MTPRKCKTLAQVCALHRDNIMVGDYGILVDERTVSLDEQALGSSRKQSIQIPKATFNRLIDWYMREQKLIKGNPT